MDSPPLVKAHRSGEDYKSSHNEKEESNENNTNLV